MAVSARDHPEYEAEALRDMIRADAWAVEHFAQFLTMVEEVTSDNPSASS